MFRDFIFAVLIPLSGIFLVTAVIANLHGSYTCNQYERLAGVQTEWVPFDNCYVSYKGTVIRYDDYVSRHYAETISPIGTNR